MLPAGSTATPLGVATAPAEPDGPPTWQLVATVHTSAPVPGCETSTFWPKANEKVPSEAWAEPASAANSPAASRADLRVLGTMGVVPRGGGRDAWGDWACDGPPAARGNAAGGVFRRVWSSAPAGRDVLV